jgi:hypothetical protein
MGVWEFGAKMQVAEKIPLHVQKINCGKNVYELENHVGRKRWIRTCYRNLGL